jgi:uncharacterized membrane protein
MNSQSTDYQSETARRPAPTLQAAQPSRQASYSRSRLPTRSGTGIARGLGWLSLGLGAAALLAPRSVGRAIGLGESTGLLRLIGVRELIAGAGLLTQKEPAPWLWSRVAGDIMDLAALTPGLRSDRESRSRATGAFAVVAGITAIDIAASVAHSRGRDVLTGSQREEYVEHSVVINRATQECYEAWRQLSRLPQFMPMLESVVELDERRSHWIAKGPANVKVEWDAEIATDQPGSRLEWRSLPGSHVDNAGVVRFEAAPGNRGTIVRVQMHYRPPAGRPGLVVARLFGRDPNREVREDLRRFKQLLETGEVPTTEGQVSGRRSVLGRITPEGRLSRQGDRS